MNISRNKGYIAGKRISGKALWEWMGNRDLYMVKKKIKIKIKKLNTHLSHC